jgi:hypothetical protein
MGVSPHRVGSPSPPAPKASQGSSGRRKPLKVTADDELIKTALKLYGAGYNIIPVGPDKKPLASWSSRERMPLEELERLLGRATGVAIVGGRSGYWDDIAYVMLVDIDDPSILDKASKLRELVESTVSWKTGPRCPRCYNKFLTVIEYGRRFKCSGEHGGKHVGCGLELTVEEAARGLGAVVLADIDAVDKLLKGGTVRLGPVELLINNYQLIPPSLHPTGVRYEWIRKPNLSLPNHGLASVGEEFLKELLEELRRISGSEAKAEREANTKVGTQHGAPPAKLRELSDSDILEIKEALAEAYKPGVRQFIWLFLSGWAAKARISPVSIAKVLKILYESSGDTDSLKTRASAIVYSYTKAGVDLEPYARELEELLGVKPYGLEGEIREEEVKGRSGLQEILEEVLGEERAVDVIRTIEEMFGVASPYRGDSVVELLDYERQVYAVANLRRLVVVRAVRRGGRLVYKERVFEGAPVEVEVYINPVGGITKYRVKWATSLRPKPLELGPAYLEDIVDRLKIEGLVYHSRLASDVLAAIIGGFIRRGRATVKTELESPGFYEVDNKLVVVGYEVREPSQGELREALELLNELAGEWFRHVIDRFSSVIRWGVIAPFDYIYKGRGRWLNWLYLYGATNTGKTTMALIATVYIWGLREIVHRKAGSFIDSEARAGHVLSQSTFPVIINEPRGALGKEGVVELIKNAVEYLKARGRHHRGSYVEIPALAPLIFTSNRYLPRDDALLRRFKVLRFTSGDRIPQDRVREFEARVKPRLPKLRALGQFIAGYVLENGLGEDPEAYAVKLLEEAYKAAGLTPPEWLYLEAGGEDVGEVYESIVEQIRGYMLRRVNEEYNKYVGRVDVETSEGIDRRYRWQLPLEERLKIVLEYQLIPWLLSRGEEVLVTRGLVEELMDTVGDIGGLESLAKLLGWNYQPRKIGGKAVKVAVTSLGDLVRFLAPPIE